MNAGKNIAVWLWVCSAIFGLRITGQLLVYWLNIPFLPNFESWYSGAISYHYLIIWQLAVITAMMLFAFRVGKGAVKRNTTLGRVLKIIGITYFLVMLFRLVISLSGASELIWFNRPIPSFFHLILASYLILISRYHLQGR